MDMEQSSGYYYPDSFDQVDLSTPSLSTAVAATN